VARMMRRWCWRCLLVLAALLSSAPAGSGHDVDQIFARVTLEKDSWVGVVDLDGLMLREYEAGGVVLEDGSNGWLAGLEEKEARAFLVFAEHFWKDRFFLDVDGVLCPYEVSLPDPLLLQKDVAGSPDEPATIVLQMTGTYPPGGGKVRVSWNEIDGPSLAVGVLIPGSNLGTSVLLVENEGTLEVAERAGTKGAATMQDAAPASLWLWLKFGFEHILPKGVDHILFILGLFLLVPRWKELLLQSGAFTVAHSITLAMVVLGVFAAPPQVVEPLIAMSIAYVGIENLFLSELKPWRLGLVFGLGLLHGMGFASVMQELPVPDDQIVQPLVGFNLGVELGQIAVLALAFGATFWAIRKANWWKWIRLAGSGAIALTGLFWTVQRLMG
jgi:hypothetical protein